MRPILRPMARPACMGWMPSCVLYIKKNTQVGRLRDRRGPTCKVYPHSRELSRTSEALARARDEGRLAAHPLFCSFFMACGNGGVGGVDPFRAIQEETSNFMAEVQSELVKWRKLPAKSPKVEPGRQHIIVPKVGFDS